MNKQWTVWVSLVAVALVIVFAFSYKSKTDNVPLSQIFSEELDKSPAPEFEYEFVNETGETAAPIQSAAEAPTDVMAENAAPSGETALPAAPVVPARTDGAFAIQVSAFRERARADEALKKVQDAGYPAYVVTKQGSNGAWHKIHVGTFSSKGEAQETLSKLKGSYKDCFVIQTK